MTNDQRLDEILGQLGISLPPAPAPKGVYRPVTTVGQWVYVSGHLPVRPDGQMVTGCLGQGLEVAAGYEAARLAALGILASLRREFGSLDRIGRLIKLLGLVRATPEFTQHPAVINGASELLAQVLGPDAGVGARSAAGAVSLPLGAAVEVEALFELAQPAE
jgi:enamine deaminase RidA (YjgF/YER057c/UK114 family)